MKNCIYIVATCLLFSIFSCDGETKVENTSVPATLHLTAENGKPLGPDIKYMPEWKAFGWFTAKDSVEWDVDVPAAGDYNVQLEWSVSDEDAGKEFILIAANDKLTGIVD